MRRTLLLVMLLVASVAPAAAQHRPGATEDRYDQLFRKYSKRFFGVAYDWRVFKAQAMTESNLSPTARSGVGARGIMQLMPSTFQEIHTRNPEWQQIDDAEWNIAAGIYYDRTLWCLWNEHPTIEDRRSFMFGSYNAGRGTLRRAQNTARSRKLDDTRWDSIAEIAPDVKGWRYRETLSYVRKIQANTERLADRRASGAVPASPASETNKGADQ